MFLSPEECEAANADFLQEDEVNKAFLMQALPDNGCLVACEKDEQCMQLARNFWAAAGVTHKVTLPMSLHPSAMH